MIEKYPSVQKAKELFEEVCFITDVFNIKQNKPAQISRKHYLRVAETAKIIASKTQYLNPEKAYVCGLLHDYGEYIELTIPNTFHGTAGYDEMMKKGYDEVAKTCLTHSFFEKIYDPEYFSYNPNEIKRAGDIISKMVIDDYDKLIQLSDLLSDGDNLVKVEDRIDVIISKYKLDTNQSVLKKQKAKELKTYFDKLCNQDIYEILGVK